MIEITVGQAVTCSADQVYRALWACERFPAWWPLPVTYVGGNPPALTINPVWFLPFIGITMRRVHGEPSRQITYQYVGGPLRGEGVWEILPSDVQAGPIVVQYTIRLRPTNVAYVLATQTPFFRAKHNQDIRKILTRVCAIGSVERDQ
jgi:hypothetical protein